MKGHKICVFCIIVCVILSICLITSFAYSNQYPAYLGDFGRSAYVELSTNTFGTCTLVFPISAQENTLSYEGGKIYNVTNSTYYGYLVTSNGNVYDIRGTRLSQFQYATSSGYQTIYTDINYINILNTNIRFTNNDSDNEFVKVSTFDTIVLTILIFIALSELCNLLFTIVRCRRYG